MRFRAGSVSDRYQSRKRKRLEVAASAKSPVAYAPGSDFSALFRIPATSDVDFEGATHGIAVSCPGARRNLQIELSFGLSRAFVALANQEGLPTVADFSQESSGWVVGAGRLTPLRVSRGTSVISPSPVDHQIHRSGSRDHQLVVQVQFNP